MGLTPKQESISATCAVKRYLYDAVEYIRTGEIVI